MAVSLDGLDHLVLTVRDVARTCEFYSAVLGMRIVELDDGRRALEFGSQRLNLHQVGHEFEPKAAHAVPGSADLCFLTATRLEDVIAHVQACGLGIIAGPVGRSGAAGRIISVYLRDPDENLLEVSNVVPDA